MLSLKERINLLYKMRLSFLYHLRKRTSIWCCLAIVLITGVGNVSFYVISSHFYPLGWLKSHTNPQLVPLPVSSHLNQTLGGSSCDLLNGSKSIGGMPLSHTEDDSFVFPDLRNFSLKSVDVTKVGKKKLQHARATNDPLIHFQPTMTPDERLLMLYAFRTFIHVCNTNNLIYFLYGGTLLGSLRHHGMIPWDDDIDVMMAAWQRPKINSSLNSVPGFRLFSPRSVQWKFYWEGAHTLQHKPFRWPYIDIFFFNTNGKHVFDDLHPRSNFRFPTTHVFPLQLRPFAGALLPAPCNSTAAAVVYYRDAITKCAPLSYSHMFEKSVPGKAAIPCSRLFGKFPFAFRHRLHNGSVVETLKKNGSVISQTTLPPPCEPHTAFNFP